MSAEEMINWCKRHHATISWYYDEVTLRTVAYSVVTANTLEEAIRKMQNRMNVVEDSLKRTNGYLNALSALPPIERKRLLQGEWIDEKK